MEPARDLEGSLGCLRPYLPTMPPTRTNLIERGAELEVFDRAVARLAGGTGGVVVVEAPAGLGKTILLAHAARVARGAGCLVRRAAPSPNERHFPFGVVRALLETPLRELAEAERAALVEGPAGPAGALLLDAAMPEARGITAIAHSVAWLCDGLARTQPLVLIVDGAQWCDRASLEVLAYLGSRIDDLPLLVVVAARVGDARAATDLLTLLGGGRSATVLHPRPLTVMGAARLIRALTPGTSIRTCCDWHRAASGNPWLLSELASGITRDTTRETRAVVRRRLAELEPRDRAVAAALAVLGDDAPPHALAQVAGVGLGELGSARDALTAAGLLTPGGDGIAHDLVAAAIRDQLAPAERERLHREAARSLIGVGAASEVVAGHLLHCRPHADPEVSEWLERAGADAAARAAATTAIAYFERGLEERAPGDGRGRLLANLAAAAFDAGRRDPRPYLREALAHTQTRTERVDVLTRLAAYGAFFGANADDERLLIRELDAGMPIEAALLDALVAMPDRHADRARRAAAIDGVTAHDPVLRRAVLAHRAWLATETGDADADACAAMAIEALDGGLLLRLAQERAGYHLAVAVLTLTDRVADADRAIAALSDEAAERGSTPLRAAAAAHAAALSLRTGHVGDAETHARAALELTGTNASTMFAVAATGVLVAALAERHAFGEARELMQALPDDSAGARARLALAEGDYERAYAESCDAGARHEGNGRRNPAPAGGWRSTAALALAHMGRRQEAVTLAETEVALAERFGAPVAIARAMLARAVSEPSDEARTGICRAALASLTADRAVAEIESVRLRLELGNTLARLGRRIEAREILRPALADADAIGASLLAERARRELVATGLRPRRAALEGASALTPRQRQIVELAAAGKGNRAIAQQLFLSIKTVETHLAAGYRKLGVSTRTDLSAAVAGRRGR
jgi:DNA-binding CsgD family transcriptional regulator